MNNGKCTIEEEMPPLQVRKQLDSLGQQIERLVNLIRFLKEKTASITTVFPSVENSEEINPEQLVPLATELKNLSFQIAEVNEMIDKLNHGIEL